MNLVDIPAITEQGATLYTQLGTFFAGLYGGSEEVRDLIRSRNEAGLQTRQDLDELVDSVSRLTCPNFHRLRVYPLTLTQSARVASDPLTYETGDVLGLSGDAELVRATYDYELPAGLVSAAWAADKLVGPQVLWASGVDFVIDTTAGLIRFREDPFAAGITTTPVYEDNQIADRTVTLLLGHADIDRDELAKQFGYVLRLSAPAGPNYTALLNAVWDSELLGPNRASLDAALAAICDSPLVCAAQEVVEQVSAESERTWIATNQAVYVGGASATPVVSVGDVLTAGARLFDAFEVIDLSQGTPDASVLPELTLPAEFLGAGYTGGLTFTNALVPLTVTFPAGRTRVEWSLGGAPADVTLFWNTVHANGTAIGATSLARLLDLRVPQPGTDPDIASLPTYINPLKFLVDNVLRYGAVVVKTKAAAFGPNALSSTLIDPVLRTLTPPQGGVIRVNVGASIPFSPYFPYEYFAKTYFPEVYFP